MRRATRHPIEPHAGDPLMRIKSSIKAGGILVSD
jgi:hypothetical protein